uniref:Putative secreted peptide n=1 Tax=Anopheles braziliensis TaxID=58242 RepID=A0A2M3ZPG4_9DIPT
MMVWRLYYYGNIRLFVSYWILFCFLMVAPGHGNSSRYIQRCPYNFHRFCLHLLHAQQVSFLQWTLFSACCGSTMVRSPKFTQGLFKVMVKRSVKSRKINKVW